MIRALGFGTTYRSHLQGPHVVPKRRFLCNVRCVTSQKTEEFSRNFLNRPVIYLARRSLVHYPIFWCGWNNVICIRGVPISNFGGITEINFRAFVWFFLVSGRIVPWNKLSSHFLTSTSSHHCPDICLIFLSVDRLSNWQCLDQGLTKCEAFMKCSQYSRRKLRHKSLRFREQMFCINPSPQYKTYFTMLSAFKFHSRGGQLGEHREP
jgi:hypothetical protein